MSGISSTKESNKLKNQKLSRFTLITSISLISFFPLNILLPSFPALAQDFKTSTADIALTVSLFTLIFSVSQFFTGPLSDKWGRKKIVLGCLILSAIGAMGCTLAKDYWSFMFFRSVQALGCGFFVLGHALVEDLFDEKDRTQIRIYYMTLSGSFVAVSPLLGSWLQNTYDWKGSFYAFSLMALCIFIHAQQILSKTSIDPECESISTLNTLKTILRNQDFLRYWWIAALVFSCYFALISVTPLIFMDDFKLSESQYALVLVVYGVAYVLGGVLASAVQRRISLERQINIGLSLLCVAGLTLGLVVSLEAMTTVTLLVPMIISALAVTLVRPAAISAAMLLFSNKAGTAASAGNSIMFVTAAVTTAALAQAEDHLMVAIAIGFIGLSLWGLLTNARVGR